MPYNLLGNSGVEGEGEGEGEGDGPMTRRGFLRLVCRGEGVVGLGLGLRLGLGLGLGWDLGVCLEEGTREEDEGEGEEADLEKKAVIWLC